MRFILDVLIESIGFIIGPLKVIILLGTLIIIHEFGHFIVAKLCGMKVLKFSIGFGPIIFKKQGKETEYSLRVLPLGGFVQLEGEDENSEDPRSFNKKPAWQRILVLLAGVTINIVFALFIYFCINMNLNLYVTSQIADISQNPIAQQAGLEVGDEIYKINNERIYNNYDVSRVISKAENDEFIFEIINSDGKKEEIQILIPEQEIGYIGVAFMEDVVYSVEAGSAGEKAGIQANDKIISINGESKASISEYLDVIKANPNQEVNLLVKRDDEEVQLSVTPGAIETRIFKIDYVTVKDLGFFENVGYAANETIYYLKANLIGIGELFTGNAENVEVQGIVGISQQISSTKQAVEFFYMMSAISLSLGIMNLLPIPGLDGGKIVFTLIEMVRRKPLNREIEGTLTLAGFGLLVLLMIFVTVSDVANLL